MRPLLHVNAIKRRDKKHSPPTTIARSPGGEAGKVGRESSNFLLLSALHALRSTLDSWAADMSATLSKGNRRSSARWLYTTFLAVVYVVVVASAVSGAALSSCFTFDVQKCRLSWPKLREIYANAKVNKRSLHKLSERQRHINWVWVTDWLSVRATGRPTSWQQTVRSRQQRHGRGRLQLRSLPGRQGPLFLLLPCPNASSFCFSMRMSAHTHTHWHFNAVSHEGRRSFKNMLIWYSWLGALSDSIIVWPLFVNTFSPSWELTKIFLTTLVNALHPAPLGCGSKAAC